MTTETSPDEHQQQEIRLALSEIPRRLEDLHFVTTDATRATTNPNNQSTGEPTTMNSYSPHLDNITNIALFHDDDPPMPSPDEMIIRQRGRRRFDDSLSPDGGSTPLRMPFQRTPTKVPLSTSMILRSSPRKRLTMGSTPPEPEPPLMPSPIKPRQRLWRQGMPLAKKLRMSEEEGGKPIAQLNGETPLPLLLKGMSQQQLIGLIVGDLVAGDAETELRLRTRLPMPDINPMEEELMHAKRQIFRSLPTSRLCKKTDSSAYSRAALHLNEFTRLLNTHTKQLNDSENWDALLHYVMMAWPIVRATPHWDSATHNATRRQCFKLLACHCLAAVKNGGPLLGMWRLHETEKNLREWARDFDEVKSCQSAVSKAISKGRATL